MSFTLKETYASLPRTTRGVPLVLNGDPKGKNILYCNGNSVLIRDIENPTIVDIYAQHSQATTVAKYSPSGFYIASGDQSGKIRIWDTTQKEHILKNEFQPIAGAIKDIAWTEDSKRIVAVGEGREKYGHVFAADTGTSVGEIMGHGKSINSVDFKPNRPYRIATASEDQQVCFFHGPPFKFVNKYQDHTNFVNSVRYAPNGEVFVSGGADGRLFIYNGKEGDVIGQLGDPAHKGGVYGICFSPDSLELLSVSADKTCKIWKIETKECVQEFVMGKEREDMQVGCLWQNNHLLSVSLSGNINYLDRENPASPMRVIRGHNKPITALALSEDRQTAYTGASDSAIRRWDLRTSECTIFQGKGHSNQVMDMLVVDNTLVTVGMDDMIMFTPEGSDTFGNQLKLASQPRNLTGGPGGLIIVACVEEIVVIRGGRVMTSLKVSYEPECVSLHPGQTEVAVGAKQSTQIFIYNLSNDTLEEKKHFDNPLGTVTDLQYSPDGAYLATCDSNKCTKVWELPEYKEYITDKFAFHMARVTTLDWTPDGNHLGTGSLDTQVIRFGMAKKNKNAVKGAFAMSHPNKVRWIDNHTMLAAGHDSNLKFFTFQDE